MPDFSTILQTTEIRALVQENSLERAFHDALFPNLQFRSEATAKLWAANVGDTQIFTAPGLIKPSMKPLRPGDDPVPMTYAAEQWFAQAQQYAGTIDTHMPTTLFAIVNLFLRNAHQLGMQAGQTLNRKVRDQMYNAALSGNTVTGGTSVASTSLRVVRLNGFTRARNPLVTGASNVRFDPVSASNPLAITVLDAGAGGATAYSVVGYTPDTPGDEIGPGVLTLSAVTNSVALRAYVLAVDHSIIQRAGGGNSIDSMSSTSLPRLSDVRAVVAGMWQQNVPTHEDMRFHAHCSPTSVARIFEDVDLQRLNTSLPDYYMYRELALGELLNCIFYRNAECPVPETVGDGTATFSLDDPFAGELWTGGSPTAGGAGLPVYRILFSGRDGIFEYYNDMAALITEAGVTGKIAEPSITNNGIEVVTERIRLIIRAPLNRLQDMVSVTWNFIGDWPVRTDAAVGNPARYKRFSVIEHT